MTRTMPDPAPTTDREARRPVRTGIRTAAALLIVAAGCAVADAAYLGLLGGHGLEPWLLVLAWIVFGLVLVGTALLVTDRLPMRTAVAAIVLAAGVVQVPGLCVEPRLSSDAYRYVWDGRVQLSGTSPYRMAPLDDRLADLRDPVLFPGLGPADRSGVSDLSPGDTADDPRTRINRPHVPTIYPPVAQLWFTAVAAVTPWTAGTFGVRLGAALIALATTALLAIALARRDRRPWLALGYGLCPAVALEAGNNGHVELLATLLVITAAVSVRRRVLSGVLLGLAIAVKVVPLLLLPALRTGLRGRFATAATVLASYLPHLLVTGWLVLGYLPGYLGEEGFDSGHDRYAVLALLLPESLRTPVALLAGAGLAVLAWSRAGRDGAAETATWLFGAAMLIGTPSYPWYTVPLLGLAVLAGRWEWLAVVAAAYGAYAVYDEPGRVSAWYAAATVVVLLATVARRFRPVGELW